MNTHIPFLWLSIFFLLSSDITGQCIADFDFDDSSNSIAFMDESTIFATDSIISYFWDFGDNTNSTEKSPVHNYFNVGSFEVSLNIETLEGCKDTVVHDIYICNFSIDYEIEIGCDEDNKVDLDLIVTDVYSNADAFNIYINDNKLNDTPLHTINDTLSYSSSILADGQNRIVKVQSIAYPNCNTTESINVSACVPECKIYDLKADITNTDTYIANVNSTGYDPSVLNILTGDKVLFNWTSDDRSVTSNQNINGQDWDSGILNEGDQYLLYSIAPGIYSYTSSNMPAGFDNGSLVSTCPDSAYFDLLLTFHNEGQIGLYELWVDGVPSMYPSMPYDTDGNDTIRLVLPGDGLLHTYDIIDKSSPSCYISTEIQAPICGITPICNMHVVASQSTPCDQDSLVDVNISVLSSGGSSNGFDIYIDGLLSQSNVSYTATETIVPITLFGDGQEHSINIVDTENELCTASTSVILQDCLEPCLITNASAGIGSNSNFVVNVLDNEFSPKDIKLSVGDRVIWQWLTDSLRSVTAFDFSFNSGLHTVGHSYTSPALPVGVHRYFSEFSDIVGSVTIEPNCNNGLIPIQYSFNKLGGANTGYNVFVDNIKINNTPIPYSENGYNSGNSFAAGDGEIHYITIIDAVDTLCNFSTSFTIPNCDESSCGIFITNKVLSECQSNNTVEVYFDVLSYNTEDSLFVLQVDDMILDTIQYDTSGINPLNITLPGDGKMHQIIITDLAEIACHDTLLLDVPQCMFACSFSPIQLNYLLESENDTCFDGSVQIEISTQTSHHFNSDYKLTLTTDSYAISDSFDYPLDGLLHHVFTLPADGADLNIEFVNIEDTTCAVDTSLSVYSCTADPCSISLLDITYGECMPGGVLDMTLTIDTFRVSDSLLILLDDTELYKGTYDELYTNPTFEIIYTGVERMLSLIDLGDDTCTLDHSFYTQECIIDCTIEAQYVLQDSCILAEDTVYTILLSGSVLNQASDSIRIKLSSNAESYVYSYMKLTEEIAIDIPRGDTNPIIEIFDLEDSSCSYLLSIVPPDCILDCYIEIRAETIVSDECLNGERAANFAIEYGYQDSDTIIVVIDGIEIQRQLYPLDNNVSTTIIGDGLVHNVIIKDQANELCADTLDITTEVCDFTCEDFEAAFDFVIDTLTRTISFTDNTTGEPNSWKWDLGDGTVSSEKNPFHTYSDIGTYTVCLIAKNTNENCQKEICKSFNILDIQCEAIIGFTVDGLSISYESNSTSASEIASYTWTVDDIIVGTNTNNGTYTGLESQTVNLCLTIETITDCISTTCTQISISDPCIITPSFDIINSLDTVFLTNTSTGNYDQTTWSLGNQTFIGGDSITYIYPVDGNYQLCMTVSDTNIENCNFEICEDININSCDADASFTFYINQDTINAELITPLGENTILYDFGNGFNASINPVQYVYTEEGDYTFCATVINSAIDGCEDSFCQDISILISDTDNPFYTQLKLYPNPIYIGQDLIIHTTENLDDRDIELYTSDGQKVNVNMHRDSEDFIIATDALTAGFYIVKITSNALNVSKSIILID